MGVEPVEVEAVVIRADMHVTFAKIKNEHFKSESDGLSISVQAYALDQTAALWLRATYYSSEDPDVPFDPAFSIRVSREEEVFSWHHVISDLRRKRSSRDGYLILGVFKGSKLAFEYQVSPRPKGVSPNGIADGLKNKLRQAGVHEEALRYC